MTRDIHDRLTSIVDNHFGTRETMPVLRLIGIIEKELPVLIAQTRQAALLEALGQCESERRACGKLAERFPKSPIHATGVHIADTCARRVRTLLGEVDS